MSHQYQRQQRGLDSPAVSSARPGKYGRMFPFLPPLKIAEETLERLGAAMTKSTASTIAPTDSPSDQTLSSGGTAGSTGAATGPKTMEAGYTFLGQFVDHDVTFDPTSLREAEVDPAALTNFRTPALTLDNLYGRGPNIDALYYNLQLTVVGNAGDWKSSGNAVNAAQFQLGDQAIRKKQRPCPSPGAAPPALDVEIGDSFPYDLQRAEFSRLAVIPDSRNDENLIIAQFHVAMQRFHNAVVEWIAKEGDYNSQELFARARSTVLGYYHGIVLEEFLRALLDKDVLNGVIQQVSLSGSLMYGDEPFIPVEFAAAAYRFGHATIRDSYEYNAIFKTAGLDQLFEQAGSARDLRDDSLVQAKWVIDWRRFFPGFADAPAVNLSKPISSHLASGLAQLPDFNGLQQTATPASNDPIANQMNLAIRNLIRGNSLGLPSGQMVARALGYAPLTPGELQEVADLSGDTSLAHETPLWYYVLKEAEVRGGGAKLGEVGSRIVAEVLVGLLKKEDSWILSKDPAEGLPTVLVGADGKRKLPGEFRMSDLLSFADFINPLTDNPVFSKPPQPAKPDPEPPANPEPEEPPPPANPAPSEPPQ